MALNVFEGARRITYVLMALWAIGAVVVAIGDAPAVKAFYEVRSPSQAPVRVPEGNCEGDNDPSWRFGLRTPHGTEFDAQFCFLAAPFTKDSETRKLIPYKITIDDLLWGNDRFSGEVQAYQKSVLDGFQASQADYDWIDSQKWPTRSKHFWESVPWVVGGPVVLWILASVIGWVMRGFMGIPSGRDHKPSGPGEAKR